MGGEVVAGRYANALFQVVTDGEERGCARLALEQIAELIEEPDGARRIVLNPFYARPRREAALLRLLDVISAERPVPPATARFLTLLLRKNRLNLIAAIATAFGRLMDDASGRIGITVTTAHPLDMATQQNIGTRLEQTFRQPVVLSWQTDLSLLGGMRLQTGSRLIDGSIRGQLDRMHHLALEER